jgi:two-component system, NarL family, sensor histidine kinase DevS
MGSTSIDLSLHDEALTWSLFDAVPDATLITAMSGEVVLANEHAGRLFGYESEELVGLGVEDLVPEALRSMHRAQRTSYSAVPKVRTMGDGLELAARRSDGTEFPVEVSLSPFLLYDALYVVASVRDIGHRVAAEAELARSRKAERDAERVMAVAEDRARIARDLHDTVIQQLFGEALNLQAAVATVHDQERTRERLDAAIDGLDHLIKDVRMAIFRLQGPSSAPGGLRGRLLDVVTRATESLGFEPRMQFDGLIESIDGDVAEELIAVLREALSNAARHARSDHVRVAVAVTGGAVALTVIDDGVGVPGEVHGGRGVSNMSTRASRLSGTFEISRRLEGGTLVRWVAPAPHPDD